MKLPRRIIDGDPSVNFYGKYRRENRVIFGDVIQYEPASTDG